jgi:hypothetical protein
MIVDMVTHELSPGIIAIGFIAHTFSVSRRA